MQEVIWELESGSQFSPPNYNTRIFKPSDLILQNEFRNPKDNSRTKDNIDYYVWLAKLAEKGKITSIFFADTYGGMKPISTSLQPVPKKLLF